MGQGVEADAGVIATVVGMAAGKSRGGQGFLVSQAVRKVIEEHAVALAVCYYQNQRWTVENVGSTESYDLRCTREGSAELHVEVKGTTSLGESVILTRNEVLHARTWPSVDLFVVTEIGVCGRETEHPVASGGSAHVYRN